MSAGTFRMRREAAERAAAEAAEATEATEAGQLQEAAARDALAAHHLVERLHAGLLRMCGQQRVL